MQALHSHEKVLESFEVNGAQASLVEWGETLWCGKTRYAADNSSEPDVEKLMEDFVALGEQELSPNGPEPGWDVCMSFNYMTDKRPSGVFFGFRVESQNQPRGFDMQFLHAGKYLRVEINEQTAKALEEEPSAGSVPPYQWISQVMGPKLGFDCGDSGLPVVEYYHHTADGGIDGCWLYVPAKGRVVSKVEQ